MSDIASGAAVASIGGATHDGERFHAALNRRKTDTAARGTARGSASALEPCDLVGQRSARRISILGSRASASRLPGSARPMVDGTRPVGADDVSPASLIGCALVGVATFLVLFAW